MAEHMTVKTKAEAVVDIECSTENPQACRICLKEIAKYTCPRCNIGYCSLSCYRHESHSSCSESFYKECVIDELKDMTISSEDKQKVLRMLAEDLEHRAEEDSDDDAEDDLTERLHGLDLDKDISTVWNRLTPKEKEDFARMLQDGRLAKLIEIWTPWWRCKENSKLVKEQQDGGSETEMRNMPEILADISDINTLLKNTKSSSNCRFDLVNILFGYCFISRIHNGCHMECPVDSTQDLLKSCAILREQSQCGSIGEAIQKALDDAYKKEKGPESPPHQFNLTVLEDVKIILSGPGQGNSITFMSAALSDLILLMQAALSVVKKELKSLAKSGGMDSDDLKTFKSTVFKSEKKLSFLLSWLQRYGMGMHQLLPLLQFEIETRQSEMEEVGDIKAIVETHMDKLRPSDGKQQEKQQETSYPQKKIVELN